MSNFAFLSAEWSLLFESANKAESAVYSDARAVVLGLRAAHVGAGGGAGSFKLTTRRSKPPYQDNLSALVHEPTFRQSVGDALFTKARLIKDLGNLAVQQQAQENGCTRTHPESATREAMFHFCYWLARTYGRASRPAPGLTAFASGLVPQPLAAALFDLPRPWCSCRNSKRTVARARCTPVGGTGREGSAGPGTAAAARRGGGRQEGQRRPARTPTTTPKPRRARPISTCCYRRLAGRWTRRRTSRSK